MNLEHWFSSKAFPQKDLVILPLETDYQAVAISYGMDIFGQIYTRHKSCIRDLAGLELWTWLSHVVSCIHNFKFLWNFC